MNHFIQKSLFIWALLIVFSSYAEAVSFTKQMKIGITKATDASQYIVIYNQDQSKCLSTTGPNRKSAKGLTYARCRHDDTDTWQITPAGKIKNTGSGKCLGAPRAEERLLLMHCYFRYSRDNSANEFIILDKVTGTKISGVRPAGRHH